MYRSNRYTCYLYIGMTRLETKVERSPTCRAWTSKVGREKPSWLMILEDFHGISMIQPSILCCFFFFLFVGGFKYQIKTEITFANVEWFMIMGYYTDQYFGEFRNP